MQYADDTLIVCEAETTGVAALKEILHRFATVTGLTINFSKSSMVPINVGERETAEFQRILQFQKVEKFLPGWKAKLLNYAGRTVLVNAVLDSVPVYLMSVLDLPQGIIEKIEQRRRAFLWTGEDKVSGANCLVAWDNVCKSKEEGGLGLKKLRLRNKSLLLNWLHNLHQSDSPWADWVWKQLTNEAPCRSENLGNHWNSLAKLLPEYRNFTNSSVMDGRCTSFWFDKWLDHLPLAVKYKALLSHSTTKHTTVRQAIRLGPGQQLVHRLSSVAQAQLQELLQHLQTFQLREGADIRSHNLGKPETKLTTSQCYKSLQAGDKGPNYGFIWKNRAPPRVRFFTWLLSKDRLPTRNNLIVNKIVDSASCPICDSTWEDGDHLFLQCPFAVALWSALGFAPTTSSVRELHSISKPSGLIAREFKTFFILCFWRIWTHRNDVVFNKLQPCKKRLLQQCVQDVTL
uniref:Reverse transcriptase domain-containing protein n=1 Tax=Oryza brachyantha TaxID=4533 RepID=J3L365_ORYBR